MFQFQCPQCANVLQAEPAQGGQQSQCPICQSMFIIPVPASPTPGPTPPAAPSGFPPMPGSSSPTPQPGAWPPGAGSGAAAPQSSGPAPGPPNRSRAPATGSIFSGPIGTQEPDILHIPCPQCLQELETPVEMLDQEVLCPHCQSQFTLRRRDSIEFKRRRQQEQEIRERKAGTAWFNWAIIVVVLVLMFLLFLIFSSTR